MFTYDDMVSRIQEFFLFFLIPLSIYLIPLLFWRYKQIKKEAMTKFKKILFIVLICLSPVILFIWNFIAVIFVLANAAAAAG